MGLRLENPDYLVCALDVDGPTFRQELYPEYKAHRPPMPADLALQVPHITRLFEAIGVPFIGVPGFEADDIMATLARAGVEKGLDVVLCTTDKDCRQLLGPHVRLLNLRRQSYFDTEALKAEWGVTPGQVVDLQSLVGDSTDNVPGAPGVGPKTAAKYLEEFGSLEALHAGLGTIKGKKGEVLRDNWNKVELSRQLVKLRDDVPVPPDWQAWKLAPINPVPASAFFREMGFRALTRQVEEMLPGGSRPPAAVATPARQSVQGDLFSAMNNPTETGDSPQTEPVSDWDYSHYRVARSPADLDECLLELARQERFAIDLETTSLQPEECKIVGIALSWNEGHGWYLPLMGPAGETLLGVSETLDRLRPILEGRQPGKINQNIKYDWRALAASGIRMGGIVGDTMVADYLLHAG
ncbi:MAG: 5'-3' exonuclease H3TH domain-containing protein, partial [Planctomycetota bacterium]